MPLPRVLRANNTPYQKTTETQLYCTVLDCTGLSAAYNSNLQCISIAPTSHRFGSCTHPYWASPVQLMLDRLLACWRITVCWHTVWLTKWGAGTASAAQYREGEAGAVSQRRKDQAAEPGTQPPHQHWHPTTSQQHWHPTTSQQHSSTGMTCLLVCLGQSTSTKSQAFNGVIYKQRYPIRY